MQSLIRKGRSRLQIKTSLSRIIISEKHSLIDMSIITKRTAQTLVNEEVRKQLPVSALRKKKERALKIYKLFSEIDEHMIQRIKSFFALTISKLKQNDIDHIRYID
ncbi:unnamed protein product [Rhizophagus irregularis]|uniref:Uncharacterized protein n=1 Tax=Rhizophagus irregularis TaxID=588596 RepID=A0A915YTN2_9GLOM|nr:unnamed protein product [Rhizophagus irregularis]